MSLYVDTMTMSLNVYNARSLTLLGDALVAMRTRRGLSQSEAARRAGVSRQWLNAAESAKTQGLDVGKLLSLLDFYEARLQIVDDGGAQDA